MSTVRIAIIYHSMYGHTARQADAVRAGVERIQGAEALLLTTEEAPSRWDDLALADGIVFGSPTYMASVSAGFKTFQEATSNAVLAKGAWQDKVAAGFTNSGAHAGDKLATLIQIALFAAQHGLGSGLESSGILARCGSAIQCRSGGRRRAAGIGSGHGAPSGSTRGRGCDATRARAGMNGVT